MEVIEVKYDDKWRRDIFYERKLERAAEIYRALGWNFRVVTKAVLTADPVVTGNVAAIQLDRHKTFSDRDAYSVVATLRALGGTSSLGRLEEVLGGGPIARGKVRSMMVSRLIAIDLARPLHSTSTVSLVDASPRRGGLTFNVW